MHPFHPGSAHPLLQTTPPILPLLHGASPVECDILARHLFAPQRHSELDYNRFVIMDELTEETKTVLLASNCEFEGTTERRLELQLVRCTFAGVLITLLAPRETILTMDLQASAAATKSDGVDRDF